MRKEHFLIIGCTMKIVFAPLGLVERTLKRGAFFLTIELLPFSENIFSFFIFTHTITIKQSKIISFYSCVRSWLLHHGKVCLL